jgi:ribose transport system substrate-binding protein
VKRILSVALAFILTASLVTGCKQSNPATSSASAKSTTSADVMVKAADIKAPAGKTLLSLPVDQKANSPLKIASIMVQNNPFGAAVLRGSKFAQTVLKDRNCQVDSISVEDFDAQKWVSTVENCISAKYDAICMFGVSNALQSTVDKAVNAGILVYIFNTEPGTGSKRQAYYGMDDHSAGVQCGQALEKAMGSSGEYIVITGSFSVLGHELRRKGARSVLDANKNIKLDGEFENNDDAQKAYTIVTNAITAHPNLKGVYVTAGGPSGAAKAIQDAGMVGKISLVCHDVLAETAPYIANGTISDCLDQDPFNQGYQPVVDAFNKLVAGIAPKEINYYNGTMATPSSVKSLFPELFK